MMAILANSAGWIEKPPKRIHRRAPLTSVPATMVNASSAMPTAPMR